MMTLGSLLVYHSLTILNAANLYTLKDLQVLEQEKNFEEFLMHVNDIRPSERQKLWKDMYQSMAMELVDYKTRTKDFSMEAFKQIEDIGRSSALFNDEFFQLKRSIYAKKFFSECYNQASEKKDAQKIAGVKTCDSELNSFWYFSKKDADVGLEFAKLIERYPSTLSSWPFYQRAINDSIANLYCEKPDIQRAVIKKLTQESFEADFDGNYKNLIKRFVPEKCFGKIIPSLRLGLQSTVTNGLEKEMAMNLLSASGKLTKEEEDLYAVLYMLDGPVVGDKMNLAWKKIEDLSTQYTKRIKILAQIKALPLIPDKIFKDASLPRNKAIINLFAKNFPEYLNFYGESCVKYLENKDEFTGNIASSLQCNEFLRTASDLKKSENTEWVSDSVQRSYSGLRK
ncbi:hypothetical protein SHI21_09875 [Bacteriovorax sp. PP10]|uniref:Uncharacterized protein n=1 Tax=Bacteriovorax antarcticus TaxID=3088717 RepID=A0ABU5VVV4_9BACT|nr:hypothetical protein [Bacteriovorax sp. PP10]MEA9356513.1 hypothetical protein [Bacteriovorax sp. PP10]